MRKLPLCTRADSAYPEVDMFGPEDWHNKVVKDGIVICHACGAPNPTMGACGVRAISVHQEYVCEQCGHEFAACFALAGCYDGTAGTVMQNAL